MVYYLTEPIFPEYKCCCCKKVNAIACILTIGSTGSSPCIVCKLLETICYNIFKILHMSSPQAYIPKRHTLIQVLPPLNDTQYVHAYIHFVKSFCCLLMHICILPENCNCHSMCTCLVYTLGV